MLLNKKIFSINILSVLDKHKVKQIILIDQKKCILLENQLLITRFQNKPSPPSSLYKAHLKF